MPRGRTSEVSPRIVLRFVKLTRMRYLPIGAKMNQLPCRRSSSRVGVSGLVRSDRFTEQDRFLLLTHVMTSSSSSVVAHGDKRTSVTSAFRLMRRRLHL